MESGVADPMGGGLPLAPVLEQLPAAVVVLDRDGQIRYWNGEAQRLFGWSREEVVGERWTFLVPEEVQRRVAGVLGEAFKGRVVTHVNANRTKDGRWVICEWRNAPLRDWQGNIVGVIAIAYSVLSDGTTSYVLGQLLQNAPIGIALVTPDKRPIFVNRQLCEMLGYSEAELAKKRFVDVTHPDDVAEDERLFDALLRGERDSYIVRKRYVRSDGQIVTVVLSSAVVRDDSGEPLFVVRMLQDITAQVAAEAEVQRHLQELCRQAARLAVLNQVAKSATQRLDIASIARVTIETLDAHLPGTMRALFAYDPAADTFILLESNALAEPALKALGIEKGAPIPAHEVPFADALKKETGALAGSLLINDVARSDLPFAQQLLQAGCHSLFCQAIRSGDELLGMLVKGRSEPLAFDDADREFVNALCEHLAIAFHNARLFADLRSVYEELQRAQLNLAQQERLRALGQMASGVVHDVNNALVPIVAFTEMLQEHSDPSVRQIAQQMQSAVDDLVHILSRLRSFYRSRSPHEELEPVDLNEAVRQAVDLTKPRWYDMPQREGITIDLRLVLDETLPPIAGVGSEIREALTNLIFNAVDAIMAKGSLHGTIILRTGRRDEWAFVEVTDTGIGMDEETKRRAFEPFFTTKGERGTGLGLAMVYGTMERHDGSIEIDSALGVGTTVRLLFPLRVVTGKVPVVALEPSLPPLRLLIVDDDPAVRLSLATMLQQEGHQVVTAGDGETALAIFETALSQGQPFDAVLTDLGMPRMSGTDLLRRLKEHAPQTPVLVMTGWDAEAKPKGADAVLSKPIRRRPLKEALAALFFRPT
jgi:PAS domain S-box-containing protein